VIKKSSNVECINKSMKNYILITGVAGNIGSYLALALLKKNYNVIGVDNFLTGKKEKLPSKSYRNFKFIFGDVNNKNEISSIFDSYKMKFVFHFAAVVGVQRTQQFPLKVMNDIDGIKNLLALSVKHNIKRFFYSSSSEVYGEPVKLPLHEENSPLNSKIPYSVVKNVSENYVKIFKEEYNLNYTIFRFFNTFGPNQSEDFVIPKFVKLAINNLTIPIYGDGLQTRTFIYIDDNIDTIINCFERNLYINDVLNIGSNTQYRIVDLAKKIIKLTNSSSKLKYLPALSRGDMRRRRPDNKKMKKALARRTLNLTIGLKIYINFVNEKYISNRSTP
jgi:UDP-glucuronate decarboxylase